MNALRLAEPPTTAQAAEIEAKRRRAERDARLPEGARSDCTAWHPRGEHCEHPVGAQVIRDEDEAGDAAAGRTLYVDSEMRRTREA